MPYKKGGGNKPELYSEKTGEYVRNPRCIEDEKNLVMNKIFGVETNKPISYPIFGVHDEEYCELVIKYCLDINNPLLEVDKLTCYLLVQKDKNDKSKLLNQLGYDLSNWKELGEQIIKGTNFKKKRLSRYQSNAFTISAETKIVNKKTNSYYSCTTIWAVQFNFKIRFVTLIPEIYKDEKN